ncbi:MAG: MMPL family transporter [Mycobacterium sp.]
MLHRIALLALAAPRRVVALSVAVMIGAAIFGLPVAKSLSSGGFQDPNSESARAEQLLQDKFSRSDMQLMFTLTVDNGADGTVARNAGRDIVDLLENDPNVTSVMSPWTSPPASAVNLFSRDGGTGLIVAELAGGVTDAPRYAQTLSDTVADDIVPEYQGVQVRAGGSAMTYAQINQQTQSDLLLMEVIAVPLSFLVLVWIFGGLLAAAVPMVVGALAIVGSMSVLRLITVVTDVSVLALNLSAAMGLALAIDYTLLIISRYRDELADGGTTERALVQTMITAGRTVVFSATTVALSMAALVLFPMYVLKSFAFAGLATVAFSAGAAIVVTPAALVLLGTRVDSLDVRMFARRMLRRPAPATTALDEQFWHRSARFVMRRAIPLGLAVATLLVLLGMPFVGVRWGFPDERVLPPSASAHEVGNDLRSSFAANTDTSVTVVVPDANGLPATIIDSYAVALSQVPDVSMVAAPSGTFVGGHWSGPPAAPTGAAGGSVFLTVSSTAPLFSDASEAQLDRLEAVPGPGGRDVEMSGVARVNRDSVKAITSRLPMVLGFIGMVTFALLFMLTGSVVLPLKALVMNALSLTATFGALVWIFQDGHLGALGTTPTGTLVANVPVLLFCIAFGLSMDYEVFLVSRIREHWLKSGRTRDDNDDSVAVGLARTARVITAAALVMSISFAALITAEVSFMRMFGVGLTLAVLVDATLVRMILVPAFIHALGPWNWWAPRILVRLHDRFGFNECGDIAAIPTGNRG